MSDKNSTLDTGSENEIFPVEPRYHPAHKIPRIIYDFFASARLAMALLVIILACCLFGTTILRGEQAWILIFNTLWFNCLLALLIVNVACCFFGRIWHRKLTVISFGMILFHLSFVAIFCAIIYNSLFFFEGSMRLTEGETLPNGTLESYDRVRQGRFFNYSHLKGETTLIKMHTGYSVKGDDKRAAYEIEVGEHNTKKKDIIYITHNLDYNGFKYLPDKEGYSTLIFLHDKQGQDLYGAHVPLQSLKQKDNSYLYTSGNKNGPGRFAFPQESGKPLYYLQVAYRTSPLKERDGEAFFEVWPYATADVYQGEKPLASGKVAIGKKFDAGDYKLSVKEIRYWVGMKLRYDPGKPIVLTSLWVGLAGMIITTIGRIRGSRRGTRQQAVSSESVSNFL
jgi:cytochrome c biogenesis protein ResB